MWVVVVGCTSVQLHISTHVGIGGGGVQVCNFTSQLMGSSGGGVQVRNFTSQLMWVVVAGVYKCATSHLNSWVVVVGVYKCATSHQTAEFFCTFRNWLVSKVCRQHNEVVTDKRH